MSTVEITDQTSTQPDPIRDTTALWGGIAFSFAFTFLIWIIRPILPQINFVPDFSGSWYFWQLPEPTFMGRLTAWGGYTLHQVAIWGCIYYAQKNKLKYTNKLHKVNIWALGINATFIILHLVQTAIWYDGTAQDTKVASSQGSVILLLVMVLIMENQRRGLFFGKKIKALQPAASAIRYYHGYIFMWAIVYTFWYHPMENTSGHLIGFFYMFLLMLQGSLFFTRVHLNKYWMVVQEVLVLFHGSLVAYMEGVKGNQPADIWAMFFFGFAAIFVVTQMYGLGLSRRMRWLIIAAYVGGVLFYYNGQWGRVNEIIRIPMIEYLVVFVVGFVIWLIIKINEGVSSLASR